MRGLHAQASTSWEGPLEVRPDPGLAKGRQVALVPGSAPTSQGFRVRGTYGFRLDWSLCEEWAWTGPSAL